MINLWFDIVFYRKIKSLSKYDILFFIKNEIKAKSFYTQKTNFK